FFCFWRYSVRAGYRGALPDFNLHMRQSLKNFFGRERHQFVVIWSRGYVMTNLVVPTYDIFHSDLFLDQCH
ncbi:MAG TPA: hypothetical protein PKE64_31375, partial [Anaerolineae bacterium]|nr:hypothetical protein [Anaerolineae bacterium]